MTTVYQVNLYEYDSYSYNGISHRDDMLFFSGESAEAWIKANGYKLVISVNDPDKEADIEVKVIHP